MNANSKILALILAAGVSLSVYANEVGGTEEIPLPTRFDAEVRMCPCADSSGTDMLAKPRRKRTRKTARATEAGQSVSEKTTRPRRRVRKNVRLEKDSAPMGKSEKAADGE